MRVVVIGATGTIGKEIVAALADTHEVLAASRTGDVQVDICEEQSIRAMFDGIGTIDAVLCAAGSGAWKPLHELTEEDFQKSLAYKLMGQVNVIRYALKYVSDGGSIAVTSGILSRKPQKGSAAISLVNSGLEGFARAAALEAPRGIRVNVVSPPWVSETLAEMGEDPSSGVPAAQVAQSYVATLHSTANGEIIEAF